MPCSQARLKRRWAKKRGETVEIGPPVDLTEYQGQVTRQISRFCRILVTNDAGELVDITEGTEGAVITWDIRQAPQTREATFTPLGSWNQAAWLPKYSFDTAANATALELIRATVPAEQIPMGETGGCVLNCFGSATGKQYQIRATYGQFSVVGQGYFRYCIEPSADEPIPLLDHALAVWMLISTNEAEFLRIANVVGTGSW